MNRGDCLWIEGGQRGQQVKAGTLLTSTFEEETLAKGSEEILDRVVTELNKTKQNKTKLHYGGVPLIQALYCD